MCETELGLYMLSGQEHSLTKGWQVMIENNRAQDGIWAQAVAQNAQNIVAMDDYNCLSVIQPATHRVVPWPSLIFGFLASGIWYSVLNQFMIQRVLGAKNMYHARMGIVLAGYMKILMPALVVVPGLILFSKYPEVMLQPWDKIQPAADRGYVHMLQTLVPVGLRGLFLAALFGEKVLYFVQSFSNQSILHWGFSVVVCIVISLFTKPPRSEQVNDQLTINWRKLNIFDQFGDRWYNNVILWWGLFALGILMLVIVFSGNRI